MKSTQAAGGALGAGAAGGEALGAGVGGPLARRVTQDAGSPGMRMSQLLLPALLGVASAASPAMARGSAGFLGALNAGRDYELQKWREKRIAELLPLEIGVKQAALETAPLERDLLREKTSYYKSLGTKAAREATKDDVNYGTEANRHAKALGFDPSNLTPEQMQQVQASLHTEKVKDLVAQNDLILGRMMAAAQDDNQRMVLGQLRSLGSDTGNKLKAINSQEDKLLNDAIKSDQLLQVKLMNPKTKEEAMKTIEKMRGDINQRLNAQRQELLASAQSQHSALAAHGRAYGMKEIPDVLAPWNYLLNPPTSANPAPAGGAPAKKGGGGLDWLNRKPGQL